MARNACQGFQGGCFLTVPPPPSPRERETREATAFRVNKCPCWSTRKGELQGRSIVVMVVIRWLDQSEWIKLCFRAAVHPRNPPRNRDLVIVAISLCLGCERHVGHIHTRNATGTAAPPQLLKLHELPRVAALLGKDTLFAQQSCRYLREIKRGSEGKHDGRQTPFAPLWARAL